MEKLGGKKLRLHIYLSSLLYFLFHSLVFCLIGLALGFPAQSYLSFLVSNFIFHLALAGVLLLLRFAFVKVEDNSPLPRLNLPTQLTLFRLTATPVLLGLFFLLDSHATLIPILAYAVLAFITDFLDGRISRRTGEVTKVGAYLDSMSDYAILLAITIAFLFYELISPAFFIVIMARLLLQWVAMGVLSLVEGHFAEHRSSLLGKASIFVLMTSYVLVLVQLFPSSHPIVTGDWYFWLEVIVSAVMLISLIEKMILLGRDLRAALAKRRQA